MNPVRDNTNFMMTLTVRLQKVVKAEFDRDITVALGDLSLTG